MMKKFEKYLKERMEEMLRLSDTYGAIADRLSDHPNYDKEREEKNALSFEYKIRYRENKKILNHFMQSVEVQSVADNECGNKYCDCHDNPPVFMDYHINAQRCTKCGKET